MHAGTGRSGTTSLSVMAKRANGRSVSSVRAPDCPVCYERMTRSGALTETRPFQCEHAICNTCDQQMRRGDDCRCPVCRAPRHGMSAAQAEPPPERNHALPSMDDMLPLDLMHEFLEFGDEAAPSTTGSLAAGAYGLPPSMRLRRQASRGTPYQRPNTGYTMRFPVEPVGRWGDGGNAGADEIAPVAEAQQGQRELFGEFMGGIPVEVEAVDALTLSTMGVMPAEVVDALLNVPNVSLNEWHEMRARQRAQGAQNAENARATPRAPRNARISARHMRARR